MQSFAQLETVYGKNAARGIFSLLNTKFFFRSPDADLARFVSHELGEEDIEDMRENYSYGANTIRDGISIGTQRTTRPIVSYSEIMNLPDLSCYVRLPDGSYPVTRLDLKLQQREKTAPEFLYAENQKPIEPIAPQEEKVEIVTNEAINSTLQDEKIEYSIITSSSVTEGANTTTSTTETQEAENNVGRAVNDIKSIIDTMELGYDEGIEGEL